MIFSVEGGGTAAFFSYRELEPQTSDPRRLTESELLSLLRTACAKRQRPLPSSFEVDAFPTKDGVLLLVSPCLPISTPVHTASFLI